MSAETARNAVRTKLMIEQAEVRAAPEEFLPVATSTDPSAMRRPIESPPKAPLVENRCPN
jgi:hypothetical protein